MRIEILGDACSKCKDMAANVQQALSEMGSEAEFLIHNDPERLAELGVLALPGFVIDGQLKSAGRVLSVSEIKEFLK